MGGEGEGRRVEKGRRGRKRSGEADGGGGKLGLIYFVILHSFPLVVAVIRRRMSTIMKITMTGTDGRAECREDSLCVCVCA